MDPCQICNDTDGDCRCSLPSNMPASESHWTGDMEEEYAKHLDQICDRVKAGMLELKGHLDHGEFFVAMQTITKEVLKDA